MGILFFKANEVKELVDHALSCNDWGTDWDGKPNKPGLYLVHDAGVYLMSAGNPGLLLSEEPIHHKVAYAAGMNPKEDEDSWEVAREAVGGDDFGELLPLYMFGHVTDDWQKRITIIVDDNTIRVI